MAPFHVPPLSPYGTLSGDLFLYAGGRAAFESPSSRTISTNKKCILLGGLSDGLMPVPYTSLLEQCCVDHGFSLVQPVLSSSYTGFGHGSLDRDCDELVQLMEYLQAHRSPEGSSADCQYCLVGHSTGCQDIVHFLKVAPEHHKERVTGAILQASVSDREHAQGEEGYATNLALAEELRDKGKQDECMPRSAFWAPITAGRFLDLQERGGNDDYFSSDFTDDELRERLSHMMDTSNVRHVLVAFSGADEYVPKHVDTQVLTDRLVQAVSSGLKKEEKESSSGSVAGVCIPKANHNLSEPPGGVGCTVFIENVKKLLKKINDSL